MLLTLALILLYISQLVYVSDRWLSLTKDLREEAETARIRKVLDWTSVPTQRGRKKQSFGIAKLFGL